MREESLTTLSLEARWFYIDVPAKAATKVLIAKSFDLFLAENGLEVPEALSRQSRLDTWGKR